MKLFVAWSSVSSVAALGEFAFACRFAAVGVAATATHMLIVWLLIERGAIPVLACNCYAFLVAFAVSFGGNYLWTFRSPGNPWRALLRFLLIAAVGFAINTLLLAVALRAQMAPAPAALLAAAAVPIFSYLASRVWGFRNAGE